MTQKYQFSHEETRSSGNTTVTKVYYKNERTGRLVFFTKTAKHAPRERRGG